MEHRAQDQASGLGSKIILAAKQVAICARDVRFARVKRQEHIIAYSRSLAVNVPSSRHPQVALGTIRRVLAELRGRGRMLTLPAKRTYVAERRGARLIPAGGADQRAESKAPRDLRIEDMPSRPR
jgi:uncharacterized protein (AIM24 family)